MYKWIKNLQAYVIAKLLPVSTMSTCGTSLGTSLCWESAKRNTSYSWESVGNKPPVEWKTSDFGVRWERFANCTLTCRRGTLNHSLDMYVNKIREVAYLPILILLGKLEHEHNPSKPVKSNAKLCRIFPFAFEKLRKSQIPNIYPKVFVSCSHRAHSSNTEAAERTVHPSRAGCCADTRSSRQ